ncbi:MAG: hypothetical protein AAF616_05135 [Bacteroidota bacterium]
MKNYTLSQPAVAMLEDNGYKVRVSDKLIIIKKPYDFIAPGILFFLYAVVALPLFGFSYWLGAGVFILLVVGVFLHRNLLSKASTLKLYTRDNKLEINNKGGKIWFSFWYVRNLFIRSKFKSEYTSAFKETSQEFVVTLGVELRSKQTVDLLQMSSDYKEPSEQINEVHDLFRDVLRQRENESL